MKKKSKWLLILLIILPFIIREGKAQSIKRQNIASIGTTGVADGVYISQTIGQPFFTSTYSKDRTAIIPGFQQPLVYLVKFPEQLSVFTSMGIFPNPAAVNFNIRTPEVLENAIIQVTDLGGKLIWTDKVSELQNYQLNCSQWKNGLYIIKIYGENKRNNYMTKVIISN